MSPLLLATALATLVAPLAPTRGDGSHVQDHFEDEILGNWSLVRRATAPRGQNFLGTFGNETTTLTVADLPEHSHIVISVDLLVIGPWRGAGTAADALEGLPPNEWTLRIDDGREIVHSTFSNDTTPFGAEQSYPHRVGEKTCRAMNTAFKIGTLGYARGPDDRPQEAVYRLLFTVKHSGASARFDFTGAGLTKDQVWGLDNLVVESYVQDDTAMGDLGALPIPGAASFGDFSGSSGGGGLLIPPDTIGGPPPGAPSGDPSPPPVPTQAQPTHTPTPGTFALLALGIAAANQRRRR